MIPNIVQLLTALEVSHVAAIGIMYCITVIALAMFLDSRSTTMRSMAIDREQWKYNFEKLRLQGEGKLKEETKTEPDKTA